MARLYPVWKSPRSALDYTEVKTTGADTTTIDFIEPMYALAVQNIPDGKEWLYEVKFDGYRCCLAGREKNGVTLWSRRGNLFTSQFPNIARACERLPVDTLFDGEIIAIDQSGRIAQIKRFEPTQIFTTKEEADAHGIKLARRGFMSEVDGWLVTRCALVQCHRLVGC